MESNINYIFGILRRHISTPCTQFLSLITSLTYRFLKDYVRRVEGKRPSGVGHSRDGMSQVSGDHVSDSCGSFVGLQVDVLYTGLY